MTEIYCLHPASWGLAALLAGLAMPALAAPPAKREPTNEVIIQPAPGQPTPDWCPSKVMNGVRFICQPPGPTVYPPGQSEEKVARLKPGGFNVALRLDSELIWQGTLYLGGDFSQASVNQSRNDSFPCRPTERGDRGVQGMISSFSVSLSASDAGARDSVSAELTRPFISPGENTAVCTGRRGGTKVIRFEAPVDLHGNLPVTVRGDAGLTVTIGRAP